MVPASGQAGYLPLVRGGGGGCIPACSGADPSPVNRMTDRCKNITLQQTSFAGDKNEKEEINFILHLNRLSFCNKFAKLRTVQENIHLRNMTRYLLLYV